MSVFHTFPSRWCPSSLRWFSSLGDSIVYDTSNSLVGFMNQQKYLVVNYTSVLFPQLLVDLGLTPQFINQNATRENYHEFPLNPIKLVFHDYPPTPALAKAEAAPGTTAGVELLLLSFPRPFASP